ncbi:MAG: hypothetical protein OEY81_04215, partial [Candidatus Bathyarchaeota archaeon]|nr:hypothetical protein [Candidatus Bathyarchaeota archaeon]
LFPNFFGSIGPIGKRIQFLNRCHKEVFFYKKRLNELSYAHKTWGFSAFFRSEPQINPLRLCHKLGVEC